MAKLKIFDNTDDSRPNVQGYVNLVDNLILDSTRFQEFLDATKRERADLMQTAAGTDESGQPCVIEHETTAGVSEAICGNNCRVEVSRDRRKVGRYSQVTLKIPETRLYYGVNYVSSYAEEVHRLWNEGQQERACKFMFGVMLLARCR